MRKPRVLAPTGTVGRYHVTARTNLQEFIFEAEAIKQMLLDIIKEAREEKHFRFAVKNFCIMDNHVHLILEIPVGESLSKLMQWVLSVFALRFNSMFKRKGHVWHDRFHSQILQDRYYQDDAFVYVADNPVKANLVLKPWEYKYNGVTFILNNDFSLIDKPPEYLMERVLAGR